MLTTELIVIVPELMNTSELLVGTALQLQLLPVSHALLVAPVQVSPIFKTYD